MNRYDALEELLLTASMALEDLYQSGFDTTHDSTLKELEKIAELAPQYGLTWLGDQVQKLKEGLEMRRHRVEKKKDEAAEIYVELNEYLYLCRQKVTYDRAAEIYTQKE